MKALEILRELEANPTLVSEKVREMKDRQDELTTLINIYKAKKTKLMNIMNHLKLPANKLIKVTVELQKVMKEENLAQKELKAIEYFKAGSSIDKIEFSLENTYTKWKADAVENYDQLFNQ